jgi:hypothetical protein
MTPGTILFDKQFQFHDGEIGKKLLVILSDGKIGFYITIKTTSQPQHKGRNEGCQSNDRYPNFFVPDGTTCLRGDSWFILNEFYELNASELDNKVSDGKITYIGNLPTDVLIELFACAIDCLDISTKQADILRDIMPSL